MSEFSTAVTRIVGPVVGNLGFAVDEVMDDVDEGGGRGAVVYYCSADCKLQIYKSTRGGEVNCMIAPLAAPNDFGLMDRSGKWRYLKRFVPRPKLIIGQLAELSSRNFEDDNQLVERVRDDILKYFSGGSCWDS